MGARYAMEPSGGLPAKGVLSGMLGGAGAVAGALTYIGLADPHRPDFLYPPCPFKMITGWNCPACGGLRMTHDLLHGDVGSAVVDNVFVLVALPLLTGWLVWRWRSGRKSFPVPAVVTMVVVAVIWTVVRNVPGFPLVPTVIAR